MRAYQQALDRLQTLSRVQVGILCTSLVFLIYYFGSSFHNCSSCHWLHLIWSLPSICCFGAIIRWCIEWTLGSHGEVPVENKAILITGCDTGFGNMLATRMAKKGCTVFAGCLFPDNENAIELGKRSERIHIIGMDVTSDQSMKKARELVEQKLGENQELWAVVANAGVGFFSPLEWCSMDEIGFLFNVNLLGVIRTVKTFLPFVRKSRGRVITTSSMAASTCTPNLIPYSMSKIAVKTMMEGLHTELSSFDVCCVSIEPFFYRTPLVTESDRSQHLRRYNLLNEQDKEAYAVMLLDIEREYQVVDKVASNDLEEPMKVFEQAITSLRPQRSYYVGNRILQMWLTTSRHFALEYIDFFLELRKTARSAFENLF